MTTLRRRLLGLAALAAIVAILVGLPAVLLTIGANPFSDGIPSWSDLTRPDDGGLALAVIKTVAWIAWAALAVALVVEIVARARGVRAPRIQGFRLPQAAASGLVGAAFALFAGAIPVAAASPATATTSPASVVQLVHSTTTVSTTNIAPPVEPAAEISPAVPDTSTQYTVQPHESLWSIAESLLGDGRRYRELVALNAELLGGRADFIQPGWVLTVPTPATVAPTESSVANTVTVQPGDTLSSIAAEELGDPERFGEIYEASRDTVQPDGEVLTDPDLIKPGWVLHLPIPVAEPPAQEAETAAPTALVDERVNPAEPPRAAQLGSPAPAAASPVPASPQDFDPVDPAQGADPSVPSSHDADLDDDPSWHATTGAGISTILAGTVIGVVATRRRRKNSKRKPGEKSPMPDGAAAALEQDLRAGADDVAAATIDTVLRNLAAACRTAGLPLPPVRAARLSSDAFDLYLETSAKLPSPWSDVDGTGLEWTLDDPGSRPSLGHTGPAPYPSLVTIGHQADAAHLLLNLEQIGALGVVGDEEDTRGIVAALAIALATSAWADDLQVTVVGWFSELEGALQSGQISYTPTIGRLLDRLEERAASDRRALADAGAPDLNTARATGVVPEAWTPEIILVADFLTHAQKDRLTALAAELPHVAFAAVAVGGDGGWTLRVEAGAERAVLEPVGVSLAPQRLRPDQCSNILSVVASTDPVEMVGEADAAPTVADVVALEPRDEPEPVLATRTAIAGPRVLVLGPVDLVGAAGTVEPSKRGRLLELAAYLALNPNAPFPAIDDAIWPDRSTEDNLNTRNTATSKLRRWLGQDETGEDYLPRHQAGAGYGFGPGVTSDVGEWNQLLAGDPLNAPTENLEGALALVRGIPFEGTHRRRYAWAEPIRQHLTAEIVDASYALAKRRLMEGRWRAAEGAVVVGLRVDPAQEALWRLRILAAHESRNPAATAEAIDRLCAISERLEVDLEPETEELLAALKRPGTDASRALGLHALEEQTAP